MSQEPYTGRAVTKWLEDRFRPRLMPHSDGALSAYEMPNGSVVVIPGPSTARHQLATSRAKRIAGELGMTYDEFRTALGHPIVKHSRPGRKPVQQKRTGCTKADVLHLAGDVRSSLARLEGAVRPGLRDSVFYLRLHQALSRALVETERAVTQATTRGQQSA